MTSLFRAAAALLILTPAAAQACACGCGLYDVGDGTIAPQGSDSGLSVWARVVHSVQSDLYEGSHRANPDDHGDKRIATNFYTIGADWVVNSKWAVSAQLPLVQRAFTTTDEGDYAAPEGTINTRRLTDLGDATLRLTYTGFSARMNTGLGLGVKLPTGRSSSYLGPLGGAAYDRDTLPGSGSTDLIVHGYRLGAIGRHLTWFVQGQYQFAVARRDQYRPGNEADAGLGVSWDLGRNARGFGVAPALMLLGTLRDHDTGANSDPDNTGYRRLLVAPGVKVHLGRKLSVYGDVQVPIAQHVHSGDPAEGDAGQLVAPATFRLQVNYAI